MGQYCMFVWLPVSHHTSLFIKHPSFCGGAEGRLPYVVHRGVEPRFSEPKSGVIPIYEWTIPFAIWSKAGAKVLLFFDMTKFCSTFLHFFTLFNSFSYFTTTK